MKYRIILFIILGLDAFILFFQTTQISISPSEASLLYGDTSFLQQLIKLALKIFGQNDFGLRFVVIFFHLSSVWLLYKISARYLTLQRNRLWLVLVFVLLPGVISAALVVSHAGFIIFGLFLYIYLSQKSNDYYLAILLFLYALLDLLAYFPKLSLERKFLFSSFKVVEYLSTI